MELQAKSSSRLVLDATTCMELELQIPRKRSTLYAPKGLPDASPG